MGPEQMPVNDIDLLPASFAAAASDFLPQSRGGLSAKAGSAKQHNEIARGHTLAFRIIDTP